MEIWIVFTIAAAALQTLRFMLQKVLQGAGLSSGGATFARFLFAAPVACAVAAGSLWQAGLAIPVPPAGFWGFILVGGAAQIVATFLTVSLFALRNFAVGVTFTKTETVQVALFSAIVLGEPVSAFGWVAIGVGLIGVLLLSRSPGAGAGFIGRPVVYGVLAGGLFGISAVGYRGATLELAALPFFPRAVMALAAATVLQSIGMALWLAWREPGEFTRVLARWRRTVLVGITGVFGSMGWFAAFSLQNAAYVRAVGQVEIVFTLLASALFFRERLKLREGAGIALVVGSLLLIVLALG